MTEMTAEKVTALRRPFPAESIGKLPKPVKARDEDKGKCEPGSRYSADGHFCGGWHARSVHLDYVGHAAATDRLLTVDPFWSWEPMAVDATGLPAIDGAGNLWIRLTICGVTRLGVGDGKNAKEAIGDAIRNAAMRFGVALDLWAKENLVEFEQSIHGPASVPPADPPSEPAAPAVRTMSRKPAEDRAPVPVTREQVTKIMAQMGDLGITGRDERLARVIEIIKRDIETSNDLTRAEASQVIGQLDLDLAAGVAP
jgi:hypothetical protein